MAKCGDVKPLGEEIVRNFDANECILAKKVYLLYVNGEVLGTTQFRNLDEFLAYQQSSCVKCGSCDILIDGCYMYIDGCLVECTKCEDVNLMYYNEEIDVIGFDDY